MAVVAGDLVDVPSLAVEDEGAIAVEGLQQSLADGDGHCPFHGAADAVDVEALDVAVEDQLQAAGQHRAGGGQVVALAVVEAAHDRSVERGGHGGEARGHQAVSLMTAVGLVQMCSGLDCASPITPLSNGMRSSLP
ncbi:hypothetical protein D3C84_566070 [compost metagenome]